MYELLILCGISVSNFKNRPKNGPKIEPKNGLKNGPEVINAF